MIKEYSVYINFITNKINDFFERQKPYIFCKKGCSLCCENGEYPWSFIEYQYLMEGYKKLDCETKEKITSEIKRIKEEKAKFKGERFVHKCPFLIDKVCSVYEYRGIICRSFGLLYKSEKTEKIQVPFCYEIGLNYSNAYDKEKRILSAEMCEKQGFKVQPKCYNVSYNFLTDDTFAKGFGFEFGEKKPLIDWFEI